MTHDVPFVVLMKKRFISRLTSVIVAADFDNVFTLDRTRLQERITRLGDEQLAHACRAYRFAVGC